MVISVAGARHRISCPFQTRPLLMYDMLHDFWPHLLAALHLAVGVSASGHVVLNKEDTRAAIGWVGIIWLTPFLGSLLYICFGVNRIHRRAQALRPPHLRAGGAGDRSQCSAHTVRQALGGDADHFAALARVVGEVSHRPLLSGNRLEPFVSGDCAYPAMLAAIEQAEHSINLATYIFDNDRAGQKFLEALAAAVKRGVAVRVLIDDVGARYTWPPIVRALRKAGIQASTFLPTLVPWRFHYTNLRNHRKIMVIDGRLGFTGGMNIRQGHMLALGARASIQDVHFRVEGPVVAQLQEVFLQDWAFCCGETLRGERWFPPLAEVGTTLARGISDGPDDDEDRLQTALLAALGCARSQVLIVTPYFLPDAALITALNVAALRGIDVNIILPRENNLTMVQWASTALLNQLLKAGCKIWLSAPPFDHTKLMLVDQGWLLIGSANWDPRSLRLNFEFNLECYDRQLAAQMQQHIDTRLRGSEQVTAEQLNARPLLLKLRDGVARLASPYL